MGIGSLLALLLPEVPALIQGIQRIFAHTKPAPTPGAPAPPVPAGGLTPDVNAEKMNALMLAVRGMIDKLKAINAPLPDGVLPASIPVTDDALRGFLESIYQDLKAKGQLAPVATPAAPVATLWLVQGTVQALQVQPNLK